MIFSYIYDLVFLDFFIWLFVEKVCWFVFVFGLDCDFVWYFFIIFEGFVLVFCFMFFEFVIINLLVIDKIFEDGNM